MPIRFVPNILSSTRILLTPVFLYFLFSNYKHGQLIALAVFVFASITDLYDGKIARKYNIISKVGIFLDPLADKMLVLSALFAFLFIPSLQSVVFFWMLLLISFRDILVTLLRMILQHKGVTMVTSKAGKWKTTLQITTIILILIFLTLQSYQISGSNFMVEYNILLGLMVATTAVTFYTGIHYFYFNAQSLTRLFSSK